MYKRAILHGIYALFVAAVIAPLFSLTQSVVYADDTTPGTCRQVQLRVALDPGQPANQMVQGTLCNPLWWRGTHSVDVLMHGATYNNTYWSWPIHTELYSYVNDTLLAGRATFAYDAIGAGVSSHPVSTAVTIDAQGFVLHQVLGWLHMQSNYAKFDVVGHSLGSITAVNEAARFHDENALVLTGYSHAINPVSSVKLGSLLYPASQDPQFSGKNFDPGYITTKPGGRVPLYSKLAQPDIIAYDEAHKDVVSSTQLGQGIAQTEVPATTNISANIKVPVLEVIGQDDFLFCGAGAVVDCSLKGAVQAFDTPFFRNAPSLTVRTVPFTGHDLALHLTNPISFAEIDQWLVTH